MENMSVQPAAPKPFNPWMVVSGVLAIALVGSLVWSQMGGSSSGGEVVGSGKASEDLVSFINKVYAAQIGSVTLKSVTEEHGLYKVTLSLTQNGQPTDQEVYVTRDGKLFIPQTLDIATVTGQFEEFQQQQAAGTLTDDAGVDVETEPSGATPINPGP